MGFNSGFKGLNKSDSPTCVVTKCHFPPLILFPIRKTPQK